MPQPTVTIITPTRNRPDLLVESLRSALDQTYDRFTILVGDDGTDDSAARIAAELDDPRIRHHRNDPALGAQENWFDLVRRAETPLVASLHDDDRWHPSFLAELVPPMVDDPGIALTFCDFWLIGPDGGRLRELTASEAARTHRDRLVPGPQSTDLADGLRLVAVWNAVQPAYAALMRRDAVAAIEVPDEVAPLYDIWISYELVRRGQRLHYDPRRLTEYRVHGGSLTAAGYGDAEDAVFGHLIEAHADLGSIVDEIAARWADLRWWRGTSLMGGPDRERSQRELLAAASSLHGPRRYLATAGGRSSLVWHGLSLGRSARRRIGAVLDDRY